MNRSDFDDTIRDMWSTRPSRRKDDRKIAGVAAAIGRRYSIDPILVRIGLVVTTVFGGVGVLLYLLGWLLLREEGDQSSAAEAMLGNGRSSMGKPLTIVLAIAMIPASSGIFTGRISALISLAATGAGLFLLHKHRAALAPSFSMTPVAAGGYGPGYGPGAYGTGAYGTGAYGTGAYEAGGHGAGPTESFGTATTTTGSGVGDPAPGAFVHGGQQPPAWDPLGVAPFAWDLPEPTPVEPPAPEPPAEKRRRSPVTAVTMALALATAGAASIVAMTTDVFGAGEVLALTLGVVGVGLVVGSFVRGGRGLIALAIPLGIVTYGMTMVPVESLSMHGTGDRTWQVANIVELQPVYRHSAGDVVLDLRDLVLDDDQRIETSLETGVGNATVLLPPDVDVDLHCAAGAGQVRCLGADFDGVGPSADRFDTDSDGEGGGELVLNVSIGAGNVEVTRG